MIGCHCTALRRALYDQIGAHPVSIFDHRESRRAHNVSFRDSYSVRTPGLSRPTDGRQRFNTSRVYKVASLSRFSVDMARYTLTPEAHMSVFYVWTE